MGNLRVLVCGYYGFGNSGDEAILSVLIRDLNAIFEDPEITVVAGDVESIAANHGVDAIPWIEIGGLRRRAEESDLMVLGGGGLFQDQQEFDPAAILTPAHGGLSYWAGFALLSHMLDKPLAIYGAGVGPLLTDDGKRLTRLAFGVAAAASVRDEESARVLGELGIHEVAVTADPGFMMSAESRAGLEILANEGIHDGETIVSVSVRSWGEDAFIPELARQLDRVIEVHNAQVVFVPFQTSPHRAENDPAASLRVVSAMTHSSRATILRGTYTPEDKMAVQAAAGLIIGMRLHSVIMGAIAGVPTVALAYDPKVASAMKSLGAPEMTLDLTDLGSLASTASHAMGKGQRQTVLPDRLAALVAKARLNAGILTDALPRHRPVEDPASREASSLALRHLGIGALLEDQEALKRQVTSLEADRAKLQSEWDHLVGTRSLQLVNSWWSLRNRLRKTPAPVVVDPGDRRRFQSQLDTILETHKDAAGIVVYPPTIGWSTQLFQRPQQMARAFARMGYLTFFGVDPGGPDEVTGFRYVEDRLCLTGLPSQYLSILEKIPDPLMVSYVYNFDFRTNLSNPRTVFEHIDHLDVFASSFSLNELGIWFDGAVRDADVVAASARDLQVEMLPARPDTILCPNGVTFEHFAGHRSGPPPADLTEIVNRGRPIIGYYGAIAEWVDYDLLDYAAERLPDFSFVFIGPNYDKTMEQATVFTRPNVWWLGPKNYAELPAYLQQFFVATIPFQVNDVTHGVSPLKLFEYMARGKPVVTTAMREAQHYEHVLVARDREEWVRLLAEAIDLGRDPAFRSSLQRMARANTWEQRIGTLIDAASKKS